MPDVLVLRHAPTDWNLAKRMQGRTDVPLPESGRREAAGWRLPDFARSWPTLASPLRRTVETARAMRLDPRLDAAFVEMDWGVFEGRTLADLRAEGGADFTANEAQGLDFRPPNGESPREVGERAFAGLRRLDEDSVIVTHKGVLRALLALACDWDMVAKPPVRLEPAAAHRFRLDGTLRLVEPNIPLSRPSNIERKAS